MLYRLGNRVWVENTAGVIEGPESLVVIDPGTKKQVVSDINDLCIDLKKPVKHLFYTHLHLDHTYNGRFFKGAKYLAPSSFDNFEQDDIPFELAGVPISVHKTPGHCELGDVSVLVDEILFTGDMINKRHVPLTEDHETFLASLAKIGSIDFKKAYGAHSGVFSRELALNAVEKMAFYINRGRQLVAAYGPRIKGAQYMQIYLILLKEAGLSRDEIDERLSHRDRNKLTHYDYFIGLLDTLSKSIPVI